jgi:hypothetical protein
VLEIKIPITCRLKKSQWQTAINCLSLIVPDSHNLAADGHVFQIGVRDAAANCKDYYQYGSNGGATAETRHCSIWPR